MSTHGNLLIREAFGSDTPEIRLYTRWDGHVDTTLDTLFRVPKTIIQESKNNKPGLHFYETIKMAFLHRKKKKEAEREKLYTVLLEKQRRMLYIDMDVFTLSTFIILDSPRWVPNAKLQNGTYFFDSDFVDMTLELSENNSGDKIITINLSGYDLEDEERQYMIREMIDEVNAELHFAKYHFSGDTITFNFNEVFIDYLTSEFIK